MILCYGADSPSCEPNVLTRPIPAGASPEYAPFTLRLRAIVIDWALMWAVIVAFLFFAIAVDNQTVARPVGALLVLVVIAYEPLLVWLYGATIGHRLSNLRVVDERSSGNPNLGKATLRFLVKSSLGIYSFITMLTTRRRQALHDIITNSTVRVVDEAHIKPLRLL